MTAGCCRCQLCSSLLAAATLMCWHCKCHWQAVVFLSSPSSIQAQPQKYHVHILCCIALLQAAHSRHKHACMSCLPAFLLCADMTPLPRNTPSCAPPLSRPTPTKSEQSQLHLQQTAELSCPQYRHPSAHAAAIELALLRGGPTLQDGLYSSGPLPAAAHPATRTAPRQLLFHAATHACYAKCVQRV